MKILHNAFNIVKLILSDTEEIFDIKIDYLDQLYPLHLSIALMAKQSNAVTVSPQGCLSVGQNKHIIVRVVRDSL